MKKISKKICGITIILVLLIALIYISDITNLPDNLILFEGEKLNLKTIWGIDVDTTFSSNPNIEKLEVGETITVSANVSENRECTGNLNLEVSLLGIKLKQINVDIIQNIEVVPLRKFSRSKTIHKWSTSRRNVGNNTERIW